ncbi:MAG: VanZ family protein [Pseudomonadota bacterium]
MQNFRRIWLMLGYLWVGAIIYLSLTSSPPAPLHFHNADKLEHAMAYGSVMLWLCQIIRSRTQQFMLGIGLMAMGAILEVLQGMTGYRSFEYADMLANSTGVIIAGLLAQTLLGRLYFGLAASLNLEKQN